TTCARSRIATAAASTRVSAASRCPRPETQRGAGVAPALRAAVDFEHPWQGACRVGWMRFARHEPPRRRIELRHEGIALDLGVDRGEIDAVCARQREPEDLLAADHEDLGVAGGERERFVQRAGGEGALDAKVRIAAEDDGGTP